MAIILILYRQKTPEKFSGVFRGCEMATLSRKGLDAWRWVEKYGNLEKMSHGHLVTKTKPKAITKKIKNIHFKLWSMSNYMTWHYLLKIFAWSVNISFEEKRLLLQINFLDCWGGLFPCTKTLLFAISLQESYLHW